MATPVDNPIEDHISDDDLFGDDDEEYDPAYFASLAEGSNPILPSSTGVPVDPVASPTGHTSTVETVSQTFLSFQQEAALLEEEEELWGLFNEIPDIHIEESASLQQEPCIDQHLDHQESTAPPSSVFLAPAHLGFPIFPLTGFESQQQSYEGANTTLPTNPMANPPEEPQSQQAHLKEAPTRSSADPLPLGNSISASPFRNGSPAPNHSAPATGVPLTASSSTTPGSLPNADAAPGAVNLPVRGTAPQDERFMLLSEIKCLRYANTMTRRNLKIPRRIDLVPQARIDITEHVTFDRKSNLDELWAPFGLAAHERKAIFAQLKAYFKKNPSEQVGSAKNSNKKTGAENKALLGELAYRLLVLEGWGVKYFGEQVNGALPRELTWPKESTRIFIYFLRLVNRAKELAAAKVRNKRKQEDVSGASERSTPQAPSSPVQETEQPGFHNASLSPASPKLPIIAPIHGSVPTMALPNTRYSAPEVVLPNGTCHPLATSTTSFRPSSAHNPYFVDTPAQSPISMPSPVAAAAPVPTRNFFMNLAQQAGQSKKRKYDELAVETSEARTCEVELPVDANMIYFVSVRDKSNGISVGEAQSFRHTSSLGENSAFAHLKASFEATGYQPLIEMGTPSGWRPIIDAHDWDTAVLGIYNHGQRNVVVDVYI